MGIKLTDITVAVQEALALSKQKTDESLIGQSCAVLDNKGERDVYIVRSVKGGIVLGEYKTHIE